MALDLSEALFTSLQTIYTADTGAGGLNETAGTARINRFIQRGDPNYDEDRADFWPHLVVDVIENSDGSWGTTSATEDATVLVRMSLTTLRDTSRGPQNLVSARMRVKYDGIVPAAQTGWTFGLMLLQRVYQLRTSGNKITIVHEYSLLSGVSGVELSGTQGSLTFTGPEGAGIGTTLTGKTIDEDQELLMGDVTQFSDQADRLSRKRYRATIIGMFTIGSMTPLVPVGTQGVLTSYLSTSGNKKNTYTNAVVTRVRKTATSTGSEPQRYYITFRVTATGIPGTLPAVAS